MFSRASFFIVFYLLSVVFPQQAEASEDTIEYGISMPVPEGYREVSRDTFPEFYDAMVLESYFAYDDLARVFVLEKEIPFLKAGDYDALSASVTAVIFKPSNRENVEKMLRHAAEGGDVPYAELTAPGKLFYPLVAMSHYWTLGQKRQRFKKTDAQRMQQWFTQTKETAQEPLELGIIAQESGFSIATWLQARNDYYSYGLIGTQPQCMTFAFSARGRERIGLVFAAKVGNADRALDSFVFARNYLRANAESIVLQIIEPHTRQKKGLRVLLLAGLDWQRRGEYAKAADAYNRWITVADTLQLGDDKFAAVAGLGACLIHMQKSQEVGERFPAYLDECIAQYGPDYEYVIRLRAILGVARYAQGQIHAAISDYETARKASLRSTGPFSRDSIALAYLLAEGIVSQGRYDEARELYKNTVSIVTESQEPKRVATFWTKFSELEETSGNTRLATFYSNITAGIMWYTDMDSKLLAKQTSPEPWELVPMFAPEDGPVPNEVRQVYNRPNSAIDTPWNKGRDLMEGPEAALYSRYGDVASALRKAGEHGSEAEKERARVDFQHWFDEVEKALR